MPGETPLQCGHCGYDVRGLPTNVCPECGSDLQAAGVRTPDGPKLRDFRGLAIAYLLLGLVACPIVFAIAYFLLSIVPRALRSSDVAAHNLVFWLALIATIMVYLGGLRFVYLGWRDSVTIHRRRQARRCVPRS